MLSNKVNLDFEEALFKNNPKYSNEKVNSAFDYIYLLTDNSEPLFSKTKFDSDYLEYLNSKGFKIPKITTEGEYKNWWGDLSDFEKAKNQNSKLSFLNTFDPEIEKRIVRSKNDLLDLADKKYYYRSEFGFSGISNKVLEPNKEYSLKYPGVISEYLDVIEAFGVTVNLENDEFFICKNIVDSSGHFLGGEIVDLESMSTRYTSINLKKNMDDIFQKLRESGFEGTVEFDSLFYQDNQKVNHYKVVEINARKTMGHIIHKLHEKFGHGKWYLEKMIKFDSYEDLENKISQKYSKKVIITSPKHSRFLSYYLISN